MESHPSFRIADPSAPSVNDTNPKVILLRTTKSHPALDYVDGICVCIFTTELLLRFITCPSKFKFIKSVYNIIDVVCVIPLLVVFIIETVWDTIWQNSNMVVVVGYLSLTSVLRVFRLFKLARHYRGLRILQLAVRSSLRELLLLMMLILMGMLVFSTLIYFAEFSQEDNFLHIPLGFWWSIITMTTVGYGDEYPTSVWGYLVGSLCAVSGILITGLPIPIIASNFNHYYEYARLASKLSIKKQQRRIWSVWKGKDLSRQSTVMDKLYPAPVPSHRITTRRSTTIGCGSNSAESIKSWQRLKICYHAHGIHSSEAACRRSSPFPQQ